MMSPISPKQTLLLLALSVVLACNVQSQSTGTAPVGVYALAEAIMNNQVNVTYLDSSETWGSNPFTGAMQQGTGEYASDATAQQIAQYLGGTVVQQVPIAVQPGWVIPVANYIQLPNGMTFNAAEIAYYARTGNEGLPQLIADLTQNINEGAVAAAYNVQATAYLAGQSSGGQPQIPMFPTGYVGPPISGMVYPPGTIGADGMVINPAMEPSPMASASGSSSNSNSSATTADGSTQYVSVTGPTAQSNGTLGSGPTNAPFYVSASVDANGNVFGIDSNGDRHTLFDNPTPPKLTFLSASTDDNGDVIVTTDDLGHSITLYQGPGAPPTSTSTANSTSTPASSNAILSAFSGGTSGVAGGTALTRGSIPAGSIPTGSSGQPGTLGGTSALSATGGQINGPAQIPDQVVGNVGQFSNGVFVPSQSDPYGLNTTNTTVTFAATPAAVAGANGALLPPGSASQVAAAYAADAASYNAATAAAAAAAQSQSTTPTP